MTEVIATLPSRKEAAKRILKAIERKALQAQQPGFVPYEGCKYAGPCAVGVLMSVKQRDKLDCLEQTIGNLVRKHLVSAAAPVFYENIQRLHDAGDIDNLADLCRRTLDEVAP